MEIKRHVLVFMLLMSVSSAGSCLFSQDNQTRPTRQSSQDAFSKGNYEQAYAGFSSLLKTYSKDPLYKYYCGACLVELKRSPSEALQLIEQALQTATVVKPLPEEAGFYLARAQQMSGKYSEAIKSFNHYTEDAGRKASRGRGVDDLIQQCREKKGEVADVPVTTSVNTQKDVIPVAKPEVKPEPVATKPADNPAPALPVVSAPVVADIIPVKEKPVSYEKLVDQGMEYQFLADSLSEYIAVQKKELDKLSEPRKTEILKKIDEGEKLQVSYQKLADQKFADAKSLNPAGQEKPRETDIAVQPAKVIVPVAAPVTEKAIGKETEVISQTGSVGVAVSVPAQEKPKDVVTPPRIVSKPEVPPAGNAAPVAVKEKTIEVRQQPASDNPKAVKAAVEIFSLFDILPGPDQGAAAKNPGDKEFRMIHTFNGKSWWDPEAKIAIDSPAREGLIYRIQIAVFRNPVKPSFFKGIVPVYGFKIEGTDKTIYYAGMFRRLSDAGKALASVKAKGFTDAFVVSLLDGKKITSDKAAAIEKEWSNKPFISAAEAAGIQNPALDTIPPALSFRVEVVKAQKPLKEDVVDGMKKVAGNRVVDIQTFDNGSCAYLIGKFITFESASEYSDLLIKNGYREARVVAFLGSKEIPVETAKQLFDK